MEHESIAARYPCLKMDSTHLSSHLLISAIVPFSDANHWLAETVASVLVQRYDHVELVLVQFGENAREPRRPFGQNFIYQSIPEGSPVNAIARGIKLASGQILVVLQPGERLFPTTFAQVVAAFDKQSNVDAFVGQAQLLNMYGRALDLPHPGKYRDASHLLQVWKHIHPPLSALFFRSESLRGITFWDSHDSGNWLGYELLCQFSRTGTILNYQQELVEHLLSPQDSLLERDKQINAGILISRKYWGEILSFQYGYLALSLAMYRFNRVRRARDLIRRGAEHRRRGKTSHAILDCFMATIIGPEVSFNHLIFPYFRDRFLRKGLRWISSGIIHKPEET